MVTDHGMAIEHPERLSQLRKRRSQHDFPISCRHFPGSDIDDFTVLASEHGGPRYRIGKLLGQISDQC